ncbi:MAG: OsmC family protein [Acidobacteria bacterium]|nr:OsmC family protein [Acidobacteriota bacterium]
MALSAERAQDNPHRITAVDMRFMVTGDVPDEQVQRAIDLSRDKYCSVWHSLRQDIPLKTSFNITTTSS